MTRLPLAALLVAAVAARAQPGDSQAMRAVALGDRGIDALSRPDWNLSPDGAYLAFASREALLAEDRNRLRDIYVLDRRSGRLTLESPGHGGDASDGESSTPDISADGRFLVFASTARNLTAERLTDDMHRVYLRDRQARTVALVSDHATRPAISDDGGTVVFESTAHCGGVARNAPVLAPRVCLARRGSAALIAVSGASEGEAEPRGQSVSPAVDAAGLRVVFASTDDLTSRPSRRDTNGLSDVYLKDVGTGTVTLISRAADGFAASGGSYHPAISADGRHVVFASDATNLTRDGRSTRVQVYVHDTVTGATRLVSRTAAGRPGNGGSIRPVVSRDGGRIAFQSLATDLLHCAGCRDGTPDVNLLWDVFLHDTRSGSIRLATGEIDTVSGSHGVVIDAQGAVVAFASRQPRDATDIGEDPDLFVVPWSEAVQALSPRAGPSQKSEVPSQKSEVRSQKYERSAFRGSGGQGDARRQVHARLAAQGPP